ncbi:autotransporter domain-containing protein [Sphingobium fuliginis]|jgi:subtilase-type serine protease|uniref:autotransporter outer membrane beta-barrel domain-containing protein n=2 Tax=Sphingobium TaxID=165695 RepID=UPI00220EC951|nr:autotransporter domain-containing protein [Sphingobium sp. RSMS]
MMMTPAEAEAQTALRFWDGSDPELHANGAVDGGSGLWRMTEPSWTDSNGVINGPMRPVPAFAIFQGRPGTVTIDDSQGVPSVTGMLFRSDGYRLTGGSLKLDGGAYTSIRSEMGATTRIDTELTGTGGVFFNDLGTVVLTGKNSYLGNTRVDGGTVIGNVHSIRGDLENGGTVIFDQEEDATFAGNVSGVFSFWGYMIKQGAGALTLSGGNALNWRVDEGRLIARAQGFGGDVEIGGGGALTFSSGNITGAETVYPYRLSGSGGFDVTGSATLLMTGQSGDFTGATRVEGSALRVDGALGGTLRLSDGGVLSGTGRVGAVDVGGGGRLLGKGGDTLHMASLKLGSGSVVVAALRRSGDPALFDIAGNLTLDGILDLGGSDPLEDGLYRLFSYGGQLTDHGLELGAPPPGQVPGRLSVQTATAGQVNLLSGASARPLLFWDGGDPTRHSDGRVDGGPGTWRAGTPDWTGEDGASSRTADPAAFAIFAGRGGQVVLDGSAGALSTAGMQFAVTGYQLSGSGLTLAGGDRTVIRVGDGSVWSTTMTAEIAVALSGNTTLVKQDAGTLILSGLNGYAGNTEVAAGTLVGNALSIRGDISNAATIVFDQRTNEGFAGGIRPLGGIAGRMVKRGSGVLTLMGASTLDWRLEEGRLATAASRFTGDAVLNSGAELLFEEPGDSRYAGTLAGAGRFIKAGTGDLTLTGGSRDFTGATQVRFGRLTVDGALGGALAVEGGSLLAGRGRLGSVRIAPGGIIAPGPGIATLTVEGDLELSPGSRTEIEVDPSGTVTDRIDVLGTATLGGTVAHIGATGAYRPSATYTILTAQAGIRGRFDTVTSSFAFLTPSLGYSANAVTLTLRRNDVRFDEVAATSNQRAAGAALQTLGSGNAAYDAVLLSDAHTARNAFDRLSGAFHASIRTALVEASGLSRDATLERLRGPADDRLGPAYWGKALDEWGNRRGHDNASAMAQGSSGALFGAEWQVPETTLRLGIVGGHHRAAMRAQGYADIDSYHAGFYGGAALAPVTLRGGLIVSWQDIDARRSVAFAGFADSLSTRYRATTTQAFAEAAHRFALSAGALEPFISMAHVQLRVGKGQESGGSAALALGGDSMRTSFATAGLRGDTRLQWGASSLTLRASAGWQHAFGDQLPVVGAALGGQRFHVTGLPIARDTLVSEIGLEAAVGSNMRINLGYSGALSPASQNHAARAGLLWQF